MLESIIIVGFTVTIVEMLKIIPIFKTKAGKLSIPLLTCLLCGILNVINAYMFSNIELIVAFKDGIYIGALASGIYATGKKYLENKSK